MKRTGDASKQACRDLIKEFFSINEVYAFSGDEIRKIQEVNHKIDELKADLAGTFVFRSSFKVIPRPDMWEGTEYTARLDIDPRNKAPYFGVPNRAAIQEVIQKMQKHLGVDVVETQLEKDAGIIELKANNFDKFDSHDVTMIVTLSKARNTATTRSKIINILRRELSDEYEFASNDEGSIRVKKTIDKANKQAAIDKFINDISRVLNNSQPVEIRHITDKTEKIKYSGTFDSIEIINLAVDGFVGAPLSFVFTIAMGSRNTKQKEDAQKDKLNAELDAWKQKLGKETAPIKILEVEYGPFSEVTGATDQHAKADIVFQGTTGKNLYVSLKDGTNPKDHQQWGGMLKDRKIMNDPRSIAFFTRVLENSVLTITNSLINVDLPGSALWSIIPENPDQTQPTSNIQEKAGKKKKTPKKPVQKEEEKEAYTDIALRATYGPEAISPEEAGKNPKFSEEFCQFIIQSDPQDLSIDDNGNLKANGSIKQWPEVPTIDSNNNNYTPIFYARRDNRDKVELNKIWAEALIAHIKAKNIATPRDIVFLENTKTIKLRGVRFLIYPYDKKSSVDLDISPEVVKESKRNNPTIDLIKELFSFGRSAAALPQQEVDDQSSLTTKFVSDSLSPLDLPTTLKSTFSKHVDKARDEVMAWLDNHDDFLKLAKARDTHAIKEKLLPLFKARQKRIDNLTLKEPKSGAPARPNDPVLKQARMPDEPIKSLLKIIDDRIAKRISSPKTTTSQLPADAQIALIATTLVAIANMPEEPEEE